MKIFNEINFFLIIIYIFVQFKNVYWFLLEISKDSWHSECVTFCQQTTIMHCNWLPFDWVQKCALKPLKNWRPWDLFCGATDTPILDFRWCLPWVSKRGEIPCLCAFSPVWSSDLPLVWGRKEAWIRWQSTLIVKTITGTLDWLKVEFAAEAGGIGRRKYYG